ncbi:MAG: hypothetical protein Q9210_002195 [Variospora velana]
MFQSLPTLHNCYIFGNVLAHMSTSDIAFAQQLHYLDDEHDATVQNVAQKLKACFSKYCESLSGCNADVVLTAPSLYPSNSENAQAFDGYGEDLVEEICAIIPANINSDVGGIGVGSELSNWSTSLTGSRLDSPSQDSSELSFGNGLSLMSLLDSWPYVTGGRVPERKGKLVRRVARKHLARLIVALLDFHMTQCFFMLATNIAALVVTRRGGLEPQSLQQIYNTWIFLKAVAINGFLPVTFTMTNLYLVGMLSWYTTLMSSLTIASSIVTYITVGQFSPSPFEMKYLASIADSGGPQECDFKQPGVYYYLTIGSHEYGVKYRSSMPSSTWDSDTNAILICCLLVTVFLLGHMSRVQDLALIKSVRRRGLMALLVLMRGFGALIQRLCRHPMTILVFSRISQVAWTCTERLVSVAAVISQLLTLPRMQTWLAGRVYPNRATRLWQLSAHVLTRIFMSLRKRLQELNWKRIFRKAFKVGVFVFFMMMYAQFFILFLDKLAWFAKNEVYNKTWNFGQIIALTVWAPPICEYIHLELRGMQRGFDHKLMPPYQVSRTDGVVQATAASSQNAAPKEGGSTEDLEKGKMTTQSSGPCQNAPSVHVGEDNVELVNLPMENDSDASTTEEELHHCAMEAPFKSIPLREEERMAEDRQWLLPGPDSMARASTFPRIQDERSFSK